MADDGGFFSDFATSIANASENIKNTAQDVRRATVYAQQTITDAQIEGQKAPLDDSLNWFQRNWFYGTTQSKAILVIGGVLVAYFVWKAVR